jgi:hypothetical protein
MRGVCELRFAALAAVHRRAPRRALDLLAEAAFPRGLASHPAAIRKCRRCDQISALA